MHACTRTRIRWATKQRAQRSRGELSGEKEEALDALGFEWDEDEADWLRWFIDLARCGLCLGEGRSGVQPDLACPRLATLNARRLRCWAHEWASQCAER